MSADTFLDTNILLYAISPAGEEVPKKRIARKLLAHAGWWLSIQVAQEFYVNATRGWPRADMSHTHAMAAIRGFLRRPVVCSNTPLLSAFLNTAGCISGQERY